MPIEVRREQVLDAALRLITAHGYAAVTMEAVAREADLAKPSVYNALAGRDALLQALLEREEGRALRTLAGAMPEGPDEADPIAALLAWARSLAHAIAADPAPWRLMLLPPDETPRLVRDRVQRGRDLAVAQARALIGRQPALAGLDQDLTAGVLVAGCEHAVTRMLTDPAGYPPDRLIAYAEGLLGVLVPRR